MGKGNILLWWETIIFLLRAQRRNSHIVKHTLFSTPLSAMRSYHRCGYMSRAWQVHKYHLKDITWVGGMISAHLNGVATVVRADCCCWAAITWVGGMISAHISRMILAHVSGLTAIVWDRSCFLIVNNAEALYITRARHCRLHAVAGCCCGPNKQI